MRKWLYIGLLVVCCFAGAYSGNVVTQVPKLIGYDSAADSAIVANDTLKGYWITVNKFPIFIATQKILTDTLKVYNADSNLVLGSGNYISFGSGAVSILDGLTDDSLVQEWNPEYPNMVLLTRFVSGNDIDTAYVDSIKIYGGADSLYGNYLIFHDSTLNAGKHRRHIQLEIPVPDRVDSLRRITLECLSNTYSAGATEFFTVAALFSRPCTKSNIDSAIGGSVLDRDSSAATSLTTMHIAPASGNWAVSPFDSRYLVISGRRDVGTAFLYSKIYKIRAVWSRTRL